LGRPFFIGRVWGSFVGQSNANAMLHSISWGQFGAFIFIGLVVYYGYVLVRFYHRELIAFVRGKKMVAGESVQGSAVAEDGRAEVGREKENGPGGVAGEQGTIFPAAVPEGNPAPEMFKVMEKVVLLLRQVISDGVATGVRRDELEHRIRQVLSGYRQLVDTPYQTPINNFIARSCATHFSLPLSDEEVAGLWKA
jgi:hypothetical protein